MPSLRVILTAAEIRAAVARYVKAEMDVEVEEDKVELECDGDGEVTGAACTIKPPRPGGWEEGV